jgi:hypothetical protein
MLKWIAENKVWFLSGLGTTILLIIWGIVSKKHTNTNLSQKSGDNSTNYQAGGDISIKPEK